ncbi:glucosaminidase domain-containing protein [Patescibacteria group bacterium]|nr:glucosaminidase domain-containing protein [Patescibacteria group bacterium]MBU1868443.1 glucosaminidase domain-containing protein [Patescibacteria group bacterium]
MKLNKWFIAFTCCFLWMGVSVFVIGVSFSLLTSPSWSANFPPFIERSSNYSLYAALPDRGSVLGHFVVSEDTREIILRDYLQNRNSPMVESARDFIRAADKYQLPWTLLPAIAGKESGFGKAIPRDSFNPFGWGVFTGQQSGVEFSSWNDSIYAVAMGIRERYFDRGLNTPELMEPHYAPPSPGKGHPWLFDVTYIMEELKSWK